MDHTRVSWSARLLGFVLLACATIAGAGQQPMTPQQLVDRAVITIEHFMADPEMTGFREYVKRARGIYITPQLLRAGFIIGGAGGRGLFLARDEETGRWSYPAFYKMGAVNFGLLAGADMSEVVLLAMTQKGVNALLSTEVKLGAGASVAAGPVGAGIAVATADIYSYSRAKGAYAALSVEGSVITSDQDFNSIYYGRAVGPVDILIKQEVSNPQAEPLRQAVARAAGSQAMVAPVPQPRHTPAVTSPAY